MTETEKKGLSLNTSALRAYTLLGALVLIWLYFHYATGGIFITPRNLANLTLQTSVTGVLAVGMLLVILAGQIDLSVGSVMGLVGGVTAVLLTDYQFGLIPAILLTLLLGIGIGLFHGTLTAYLKIPAFIVTLGGLLAWRGALEGVSGGKTVSISDLNLQAVGQGYVPAFLSWTLAGIAVLILFWTAFRKIQSGKNAEFGRINPLNVVTQTLLISAVIVVFVYLLNTERGVPNAALIWLVVALFGFFITNHTTFGRYLYAIGGNPDAARLSGINNERYILAVYALLGVLTVIAAMISVGRNAAVEPNAGTLKELDAIAACVIGGASLMGGRGTVFGACLGALIMASLDNGMSLLNVESYMQSIIKGSILVTAVGLDMFGRKQN